MQIKSISHNFDYESRSRGSRIYVWPEGETILDNLRNRRMRPYNAFRKKIIPNVLTHMGWPADTKVRWSQKAGCRCGCSPGFIVDDFSRQSVHVTITD